ncbi:protein phosphatase 2C domain-containing protein [Paenibacillus gallinarum]|uniref:Protein phosphatase 2C domain-containing protein n=1 Tax=Paenibacillus gallinarum TaxID=2762232 RepID=A0ABR8T4G5_9BACL|nr:protein phosphatase 2C domain-containing protein [Paenibacillus gallinarum]MBD7970423.1 protein phosphatase 2C domain-containing protein [Paenibacillus gallinarum]
MKMKNKIFRADFDENIEDTCKITFNAISVKGERHQRNNENNQDFFKCNIENKLKYAIVTDGLGSAKYSHIGSQKATELLEKMINEKFHAEENLSEIDVYEFNSEFLETWRMSFHGDFRDFDTTLLYIIIFTHGILVGSIGDGLILYSMQNEIVYIKEKKNFFSNQTYSLASEHAIDFFDSSYTTAQFNSQLPMIFILATDGVSDDLEPEMVNQLPTFLYGELQEKGLIGMQEVIEDWIINWETENHSDDRTFCLLAIWKG